MKDIIYEDGELKVLRINSEFWVRYDAGAHQIEIREDRISEEEANLIISGVDGANKVMFGLQKRLKDSGVNPYKSNVV